MPGSGPIKTVQRGDPITPSFLNKILRGLTGRVQGSGVAATSTGSSLTFSVPRVVTPRPFILAKITGHTAITANARWKYAWSEVYLDASGDDYVPVNARSGTTTSNWALNLTELNNTTASAIGGDGVNPSGTDYPAGFLRRPVGSQGTADTHAVDVVVLMYAVQIPVPSTGGPSVLWVFQHPNAHDGTCT